MFKKLWMAFALMLCGGCSSTIHTAFLSPVCIKPYKNYKYHICHDVDVVIQKKRYRIPAGFQTDLASIPRLAWSVMSPAHSSLIRPAIVHDYFYNTACEFTRKQTDLIFYHMLVNDGISSFRASIMYAAVRIAGWKFFKQGVCDGN
jgi:hypothetical protein